MSTATVTKASIYLDSDLWKAVRQIALDEGTSATSLVEEAIRGLVERRKDGQTRTK